MRGQKEFVLVSVALLGGLAACSGSNLPPPSPERSAASALVPDSKPPEPAADARAPKERSISDCPAVGEPMAAPGPAIGGQERKDLLASMMKKHRDKFRCCYDVARRQNPAIKGGAFIVEFQLKSDGSIKSAGVNRDKSEIKDDVMDSCAVAVARTFQFPASAEGKESTIPYPYTFTPQGNAQQ